jgi:hypothetical protein
MVFKFFKIYILINYDEIVMDQIHDNSIFDNKLDYNKNPLKLKRYFVIKLITFGSDFQKMVAIFVVLLLN